MKNAACKVPGRRAKVSEEIKRKAENVKDAAEKQMKEVKKAVDAGYDRALDAVKKGVGRL